MFNDWTYPHFIELLDELGVGSRSTTMSFSVDDEQTGLEYNGHSLNTLFAQRRNLLRPNFYRMLADVLRFNREARRYVAECDEEITVGEFLLRHQFSEAFTKYYLLPMGAAILVLSDRSVCRVSDSVHRGLLPQSRFAQRASAADVARC